MIGRLAWRSAWRSPRRTGIVITAISVGMAGCLLSMGINIGMVLQMVDTAIATELGHIQIHAKGYVREASLDRQFALSSELSHTLDTHPLLQVWAPRVKGEGLVSSTRASVGVRVVGIDLAREAQVSIVQHSLTQGSFVAAPHKVLIGEALAKRLRVTLGEKIVVSVQNRSGDLTGRVYRVTGMFRSSSADLNENAIFVSIADAQQLFGLGEQVSEIVILAQERSQVAALQASLRAELDEHFELHDWQKLRPLLMVIVESFDMISWYLYGAVFVAMAFGIANVLLMTVYERTREIGMMMALGMKRPRVIALIVVESLLVTFAGLLLGFAVAALGFFLMRGGIDFASYSDSLERLGAGARIVPQLRTNDILIPVVVASLASLLASLWPALRAASLRPSSALRHV